MVQLDRIYVRGFHVINDVVPRGLVWARRSDHMPLIAELEMAMKALSAERRATPERCARPRRGSNFRPAPRPIVYAGNRVRLLQNGEEFFPQLLAAIDAARRSIQLETYLFADDNIGTRVAAALAAAAGRGVAVKVLIDGFGGADYARKLVKELGGARGRCAFYRPTLVAPRAQAAAAAASQVFGVRRHLAFVAGINIIDDFTILPERRAPAGPAFRFCRDVRRSDRCGSVADEQAPLVDAVVVANARRHLRPRTIEPTASRQTVLPRCCCAITCAIAARSNAPTSTLSTRTRQTC